MDWKAIKENIYFEDGAFRDILVYNITRDDWRKWVEYVSSKYKVSTNEHETQITKESIDFNYILSYWDGKTECSATTSVKVESVIVNAHYFDDLEFENDITPREVKSIEHHNAIIKYMTDLSKLFNKKVIMTLENCPEIILVTVDQDVVNC